MQVENSVKPNKRFIIEDLGNGKCTVSFFYNIVEEIVGENDKRYLYDMYAIELDNREELSRRNKKIIMNNGYNLQKKKIMKN